MKKSKLLRDKRGHVGSAEHADYIRNGGEPYRTVTAPDEIMNLLLIGKLHEEAEEIRENMTDISEYADALQVLMDLAKSNGVIWALVEEEAKAKARIAGRFTEPRILIKD